MGDARGEAAVQGVEWGVLVSNKEWGEKSLMVILWQLLFLFCLEYCPEQKQCVKSIEISALCVDSTKQSQLLKHVPNSIFEHTHVM